MTDEMLFRKIINQSDPVQAILAGVARLEVEYWYVGAGFLAQTVWNYCFGLPALYGIKDIDVAYYDPRDLSEQTEKDIETRLRNDLPDFPLAFDVKNQARVHLWYASRFGHTIPQYVSLEAAIDTWPTTATAIGIRQERGGQLKIYTAFGLTDLLEKTVRPNKVQITREIYEKKASRWSACWPGLMIIPWDAGQLFDPKKTSP